MKAELSITKSSHGVVRLAFRVDGPRRRVEFETTPHDFAVTVLSGQPIFGEFSEAVLASDHIVDANKKVDGETND